MAIFTDHQANTLGKNDDTDLVTFTDGQLDIAGTLDATNFKVGGAQGTDGQVLTSTGSGVGWEDAGGGGGGGSMTLIATQTVSSSTASINFTSLGSFTRFRAIGSFEMSAGGYQGIKLYDNGSLISGSQYSSFRCTNYATPSTYNGAYGFITNGAIKNGFFIFDIAMVDGRPYVKMDVSGQEGDTNTGQKQDNTAGCLVDSYSLTSLTGFSFAPLGAVSTATYTTAKVSLYGISTS